MVTQRRGSLFGKGIMYTVRIVYVRERAPTYDGHIDVAPCPLVPRKTRQGATRLSPDAGDRVNQLRDRPDSADEKLYELHPAIPRRTFAALGH